MYKSTLSSGATSRYDVIEDADKIKAMRQLEKYRSMLTEFANVDQTVDQDHF